MFFSRNEFIGLIVNKRWCICRVCCSVGAQLDFDAVTMEGAFFFCFKGTSSSGEGLFGRVISGRRPNGWKSMGVSALHNDAFVWAKSGRLCAILTYLFRDTAANHLKLTAWRDGIIFPLTT